MTTSSRSDRAWRDTFVGTLRLEGADADTIGARVAEVEAHCRDSGESSVAAFGPAEAYARSLGVTLGSSVTRRHRAFGIGLALVTLSYPVVAFSGLLGDGAAGSRFPWQSGALLGIGSLTGVVGILPGLRLRGLTSRASGWLLVSAIGLAVILGFGLPHPLFTTPRTPTVIGFVAILLAGAALLAGISWRTLPRDPVSGRTQPRDRALALVFPLVILMPIVSAIERLRR